MKNISLKAKILILSVFMVSASVVVGGISSVYSQKTLNSFHDVVEGDVPAVQAVNSMLRAYRMARIELLQIIAEGTSSEADEKSKKNIEEQWKLFDANNKAYLDVSTDAPEEEKQIYAEYLKRINIARDIFKQALELYEKSADESSPERRQMIKLVAIDLQAQNDKVREFTSKLIELQKNQIKESSETAFKAAQTGTMVSILFTAVCALVGLAGAFIFSTKLSRQIDQVISSIAASSREVAAASTQIAKTSEELSQSTTEQAASLSETAASLEEINAMIGKAAESASATEKTSAVSHSKAEEGRQAVGQMLSSIEEISRSNEEIVGQVNHSNQQMAEIVRVIQEIGNKTKVINEIVFQTKLLSFNASVEAARAGEHGKGFAVVAEEVGNLAQMSGNAAKEISDMLDGSISKVENIVKESKAKVESLVESGKQKLEVGVDVARQCSAVLEEIVSNVAQVTTLSQEISQASREQSQGVGEINKAMGQLDSVTQQNSATSEQAASAAEQLSAQAITLKSAVDELAIVIRGGVSTGVETSSRPVVAKASVAAPAPVIKKSEVKPPKTLAAKKESKPEPKKSSNVIPLKATKKKPKAEPVVEVEHASTAPVTEFKMASGESATPSRDSDGFDE